LAGIAKGAAEAVIDLDLLQERTAKHEDLVRELAAAVAGAGFKPKRPTRADLAWREEGRDVVAEVKTLPAKFDDHQLRLGLGQVLQYRTETSVVSDLSVNAVLWVEREPEEADVWVAVCTSAGVRLAWPGGPPPFGDASA
jgi:hypothetical protein